MTADEIEEVENAFPPGTLVLTPAVALDALLDAGWSADLAAFRDACVAVGVPKLGPVFAVDKVRLYEVADELISMGYGPESDDDDLDAEADEAEEEVDDAS